MNLCCLVNPVRRCTGCDFIVCIDCWKRLQTGKEIFPTDEMHRKLSPDCRSKIWYLDMGAPRLHASS